MTPEIITRTTLQLKCQEKIYSVESQFRGILFGLMDMAERKEEAYPFDIEVIVARKVGDGEDLSKESSDSPAKGGEAAL